MCTLRSSLMILTAQGRVHAVGGNVGGVFGCGDPKGVGRMAALDLSQSICSPQAKRGGGGGGGRARIVFPHVLLTMALAESRMWKACWLVCCSRQHKQQQQHVQWPLALLPKDLVNLIHAWLYTPPRKPALHTKLELQ